MLRVENSKWWKTRRWWVQSLVWLISINGIVALDIQGSSQNGVTIRADGIELVLIFLHMFTAVGVAVFMQSAIVGEKQSGTAAWILSKPATRSAFVLSKALATLVASLLILIGLQALVAYGQISYASGSLFPVMPFMMGVGMAALHLAFYLTLTLMLGTII